jgi:hypothetical protein
VRAGIGREHPATGAGGNKNVVSSLGMKSCSQSSVAEVYPALKPQCTSGLALALVEMSIRERIDADNTNGLMTAPFRLFDRQGASTCRLTIGSLARNIGWVNVKRQTVLGSQQRKLTEDKRRPLSSESGRRRRAWWLGLRETRSIDHRTQATIPIVHDFLKTGEFADGV